MDWIPEQTGDLLSNVMEDGAVIVTPSDGRLSVVNEVGAFIWELIDGRNSVSFIVAHVTESFDVTPEKAQTDVLTFLQALEDRGLIARKAGVKPPES